MRSRFVILVFRVAEVDHDVLVYSLSNRVRDYSLGLPHDDVNQSALVAVEIAKGFRSVATQHLLDCDFGLVPRRFSSRFSRSSGRVVSRSAVVAAAVMVRAASWFATGTFESVPGSESAQRHTEITAVYIFREVFLQCPGKGAERSSSIPGAGARSSIWTANRVTRTADLGIEILGFEQFFQPVLDLLAALERLAGPSFPLIYVPSTLRPCNGSGRNRTPDSSRGSPSSEQAFSNAWARSTPSTSIHFSLMRDIIIVCGLEPNRH